MQPRGQLYIIAAPSGAGKTTLVQELVATMRDLAISVSHTTRQARPGEIDGVNYHFVSDAQFNNMVAEGVFIEHAEVFQHQYGTSKHWVEDKLASGIDVILEIDWQGAQQVRKAIPDCISVFIAPPSIEALLHRLTARGQDTPDVIQDRMDEAHSEMAHCHEFDYLVFNEDFSKALADLTIIISANRLRYARMYGWHKEAIDAMQ